jgi:endonuclease III
MLNCTTRVQMERVIGPFLERWPTPYAVLSAGSDEMAEVVRSLGIKTPDWH